MIKKPVALGFVICNSIYTLVCIARFFYTRSQVIFDINNSPPFELPRNSLWYIVPQLLYIAIFAGLLWLLKAFSEKFWIQLSVIMFTLMKISTLLIIHFNNSRYLLDHAFVLDVVNISNFGTLLYLCIALLLVRNDKIRLYFRWFVITMLLAVLLPRIGEILSDDFGIHWFLVNPDAISELCFVITLILFVKVFMLSSKNSMVTTG